MGPHFWRPHSSLVDTRQQAIIRSSLKVGVGFPRRALELSRRHRLSGACRCRRPLPRLARPSLAAYFSGDSVCYCASLSPAARSRAARRRAAGNQALLAAPLSPAALPLSLCPEGSPVPVRVTTRCGVRRDEQPASMCAMKFSATSNRGQDRRASSVEPRFGPKASPRDASLGPPSRIAPTAWVLCGGVGRGGARGGVLACIAAAAAAARVPAAVRRWAGTYRPSKQYQRVAPGFARAQIQGDIF